MTTLLEQAFAKAAELTTAEQDVLASRLMAELAEEDEFDRAIAQTSGKLVSLARQALAEHQASLTEELDPESIQNPYEFPDDTPIPRIAGRTLTAR
jgi:hypothetical protein